MAWRCATEKVATPKRPARRLARMPDHRFGDDPGLLGIRAGISTIVVRIGQIVEFQAHAGDGVVGAGYDEEPIVVELLVRDRDQRLMLAAIVPVEHPVRKPLC